MSKDRKRKGPKSTRAGCLLCKPHKHQAVKKTKGSQTIQERRGKITEREYRKDV